MPITTKPRMTSSETIRSLDFVALAAARSGAENGTATGSKRAFVSTKSIFRTPAEFHANHPARTLASASRTECQAASYTWRFGPRRQRANCRAISHPEYGCPLKTKEIAIFLRRSFPLLLKQNNCSNELDKRPDGIWNPGLNA